MKNSGALLERYRFDQKYEWGGGDVWVVRCGVNERISTIFFFVTVPMGSVVRAGICG
jgi:hypothetical protein